MSGANLTLPQDGHAFGTGQRFSPLANISFPLLTIALGVGSESHVPWLVGCTHYYYVNNFENHYWIIHIQYQFTTLFVKFY